MLLLSVRKSAQQNEKSKKRGKRGGKDENTHTRLKEEKIESIRSDKKVLMILSKYI